MSSTFPEALFALHLRPLVDRLSAEAVLMSATAVDETQSVLTDPRLDGETGLVALYSGARGRCLLAWPDGSLGFAYLLHPGRTVADAVGAAYDTARDVLEAVHLQHLPPAAPEWSH